MGTSLDKSQARLGEMAPFKCNANFKQKPLGFFVLFFGLFFGFFGFNLFLHSPPNGKKFIIQQYQQPKVKQ